MNPFFLLINYVHNHYWSQVSGIYQPNNNALYNSSFFYQDQHNLMICWWLSTSKIITFKDDKIRMHKFPIISLF